MRMRRTGPDPQTQARKPKGRPDGGQYDHGRVGSGSTLDRSGFDNPYWPAEGDEMSTICPSEQDAPLQSPTREECIPPHLVPEEVIAAGQHEYELHATTDIKGNLVLMGRSEEMFDGYCPNCDEDEVPAFTEFGITSITLPEGEVSFRHVELTEPCCLECREELQNTTREEYIEGRAQDFAADLAIDYYFERD